MAETIEVQSTGAGVQIHGPFIAEWRVTIDGYLVPHVSAFVHEDGLVGVVVDRRFGLPGPVPVEELERWLPILAHAMAVAAGYSSHGANCQPINEFKLQVGLMDLPRPKPVLSLVEKGLA